MYETPLHKWKKKYEEGGGLIRHCLVMCQMLVQTAYLCIYSKAVPVNNWNRFAFQKMVPKKGIGKT